MCPLVVLVLAAACLGLAQAAAAAASPREIRVKTLSGATIKCRVGLHDRVAKIKELIEKQTGVPKDLQVLSYNGERLQDEDKLRDWWFAPSARVNLVLFSERVEWPEAIEEEVARLSASPHRAPIFRETEDETTEASPATSRLYKDPLNWVFSNESLSKLEDLFDPVAHLDLTWDDDVHLGWAKNRIELFGPESVPTINDFGHYGMLRAKILMNSIDKQRSNGGIQMGASWRAQENLAANINNYAPDAFGEDEIMSLYEVSEWVRQQLASDASTGEGNLGVARQREINREVVCAYLEALGGAVSVTQLAKNQPDGGQLCFICRDGLAVERAVKLPCGHTFHVECAAEWVRSLRHQLRMPSCPDCRSECGFPYTPSVGDRSLMK